MLQSRTVGKNKKMNTIKTSQPRPQTRQQSQAQSEQAFATPTRTQIQMFGILFILAHFELQVKSKCS